MRQLNATGWMHNRLRMIVASFLTKICASTGGRASAIS
jgi:deoxyribodipyrimidine photo-lyase